MDEKLSMLLVFVQSGGILAPISFIAFHIIRQFLFIPVSVVLIAGGVLFGTILGTIYSLIGLTIVSLMFYYFIKKLPKLYKKIVSLKKNSLGHYQSLTISQISIIRLIPFIHYQLMNLYLLERNRKFKSYFKSVLFTNIPLAFIYTVFGEFIRSFTLSFIIIILLLLSLLVYALREKHVTLKWNHFFKESA